MHAGTSTQSAQAQLSEYTSHCPSSTHAAQNGWRLQSGQTQSSSMLHTPLVLQPTHAQAAGLKQLPPFSMHSSSVAPVLPPVSPGAVVIAFVVASVASDVLGSVVTGAVVLPSLVDVSPVEVEAGSSVVVPSEAVPVLDVVLPPVLLVPVVGASAVVSAVVSGFAVDEEPVLELEPDEVLPSFAVVSSLGQASDNSELDSSAARSRRRYLDMGLLESKEMARTSTAREDSTTSRYTRAIDRWEVCRARRGQRIECLADATVGPGSMSARGRTGGRLPMRPRWSDRAMLRAMNRRDWLAAQPFTLSLSAGFFGFFSHTGLLAALEHHDLRPRRIVGVSAGALAGGLWASGLSAESLASELLGLRREDFWDPGLPLGGLLRGRRFAAELHRVLAPTGVRAIEDCPVAFVAIAHDVLARRTLAVDHGDLALAIRASCTVPLMFRPVWSRRRLLVDGGVSDRIGRTALAADERVLVHYIPSRRRWRRGGSTDLDGLGPAQVLVTPGVPALGPFALGEARRAFEVTRDHAHAWLEGELVD